MAGVSRPGIHLAAPELPQFLVTDTAIRQAYNAGMSLRALATATGRPRSQVRRLILTGPDPLRTNVTLHPEPAWWTQHLQGASVRQMAIGLGVSDVTVYRHLKRLGINLSGATDLDRWLTDRTRSDGSCLRWLGTISHDGYPMVRRQGRNTSVRRVVWTQNTGSIPPGAEVSRRPECRHRDCVKFEHLEVIDPQTRIQHMAATGRFAHGERHWNAKLSEEQATAIRSSPLPSTDLAAAMGVSAGTIRAIRAGRRWKPIHPEPAR